MAGLTGTLMDMAAREEAMEAAVVDGQVRWTVEVCLRATESELTGRAMLVAMGSRATEASLGAGMREGVAKDSVATRGEARF